MPDPQSLTRPGLAIVLNSVTPYHIHLHRLIAAGIPELKLHVLVTHGAGDFPWQVDIPPEIHLEHFGTAGEHPAGNPFRRPVWEWRKGGRLIEHLRKNAVRAVIINGCYRFPSYLRVASYCGRANIPAFVNADNNIRSETNLTPMKRAVKSRFYRWWIKRLAGVMPMGTLGDQFFLQYGADAQRIYHLPYWPDFESFARVDEVALERFQRKFGLDRARRRLLFSGRLVPEKRVDLLIDAFAGIANRRPDWDLLIAGDGILRDELQRRVPDAVRSRVVWTGFLDRQEPALANHAADVLVLPSDREPWALVVQEAMAAGLVVVSSDVSGAAYELVEDRRNGRIFPAGDLEQLKQAILDVTEADALPTYKRESAAALGRWRSEVDPVAEIRRALSDARVLKADIARPKTIPAPTLTHG